MITLMDQDLITRVIDALPRDVMGVLVQNPEKVILAGGFIRSVVQGEEPNDIDLFITDQEAAERAEFYLRKTREVTLQSRNAVTFGPFIDHAVWTPPVQIVTRWQYTPLEHIERFDFTICQACIYYSRISLLGYEGLQAEWFVEDSLNKKLVYTRPVREEEPLGSMHRAIKFVSRGYSLSGEQFARLAERMVYRVLRVAEEENITLFWDGHPGTTEMDDATMNKIWRTWSWRAGRGSG